MSDTQATGAHPAATRLRLAAATADEIHAQLERAYPEEGCGVLLGRDTDHGREIVRVIGLSNEREDSRHNRYLIAPEQFLAAEREARSAGLDVVGFYHSHPDHPAEPSRFDLDHAWPFYSYVIASVQGGKVADVQSYRLNDDRSRFESEVIEILPGVPGRAGEQV